MDIGGFRRGVGLCTGGLGLLTLLLSPGTASAEPEPVPDPAAPMPVEAPPVPLDPFAATSVQTKDSPVEVLAGLLGSDTAGSTMALANQGIGLTDTPPVNPLADIGGLIGENFRMPSGDEVSPYVLQTNVEQGPFARVNAFKGAHALGHAGLGRMPGHLLGTPLPGVEPPPGTNIPAGLEQYYVPPAAPADVPPPVPPFPPAN